MLDLFGIVFSSTIMMLVIIRAVQLDRTQAWFQSVKRRSAEKAAEPRRWLRRR